MPKMCSCEHPAIRPGANVCINPDCGGQLGTARPPRDHAPGHRNDPADWTPGVLGDPTCPT